MAERVVIDPLTRIEGHLRIELERDGKNITNAWSETTQFRGIETIVKGRDPRDVWAFVGRICGVCTSTHSVASVMAVEDAIGSQVPKQAELIRDILLGAQEIHDHVVHFYHLHALDWVNVVSAAEADPKKAVEFANKIGSKWKGNTESQFAKVKKTIQGILDSGQLSIFTGGYWDHPDYRLPAEANLMAVSHYLDALEFQRSIIRITTIFGGKNPHPNFLVGGMACNIDPNKSETFNQVQLDQIKDWTDEIQEFVKECYYPDAVAIMGAYKDYFKIGASSPNFLAIGMAGTRYAGGVVGAPRSHSNRDIKPGVILDGDYSKIHPLDHDKIREYISSAWYSYEEGDDAGLHPLVGETTVNYTGPQPPYTWLADGDKYTWSKAPRYDGRPTQVGPVARVLSAYIQGHAHTRKLVDDALRSVDVQLKDLNSTAGRTLARAVEAITTADHMAVDLLPAFVQGIVGGDYEVFDSSKWEPDTWPKEASDGFGLMEVARGCLGHYVTIEDQKVTRYQAVVPTTWLAGGRAPQGNMGPYEESLAGGGHPLLDPKQPLEPLRTIHSFDPCMSCAVHVLDVEGHEEFQVMTS
ncbi:nickel-dependent hydrogenase large subunit [Corynebacterium belfantii]|uniref:nickel-dependent hydrogenase large subunit n=1 Tax=Corynebacterium belfantii TaxID=2014537 RepID=UPI0018C955DC|nr:nickel-dependent hydrogenase large subunit [Corynebacterium belfantii]MBG9258379.1 nickel-dependent hydrogenase large subunit [Corynebacterium belfantii]MBG9265076.1 nickel-dependent hydrogenase large subunit [Corynebacterium belfantii]MBG9298130.1 nickel-dependent hydrogenase large subunit [Corynebacterium belfantii]MBG9307014.1 nickel-dependent hydrogenase large subunit [Corynebacterium belfantii]MBG9349072.1 nickel-dependent hydrogenase large subunit [Corynebacterium belfantii]